MAKDADPRRDGSKSRQRRGTSLFNGNIQLYHRSRNLSQIGDASSNANKRGFLNAQCEKKEQQCGHRDIDSIGATVSTIPISDDDSSISSKENRDDRNAKGCRNAAHDLDDAEKEDGYDTDNAVVVCDETSLCSKRTDTDSRTQQQCDEERTREKAKQIAEQILLEQVIAVEAWDEVAVEYHHRTEPFTSLFVPHLLDPECLAGKSVLDVAAGTGAGALYASSRGAASVMATDFSENMLQILRSRIDDGNNDRMEAHLANGLCLPLSWANRYDVVFSNFGVIYFPRVKEGVVEMVRCTKPGGRVCISSWGSKEETPAFRVFPTAMKLCGFDRMWRAAQKAARDRLLALAGKPKRRKRGRHGRSSLAPNYFCPSTRVSGSLHSVMEDAGLDDVRVTLVRKDLQVEDAESYWNRFVLASPNLKRFVEQCLSPGEVARLKDAVSGLLDKEISNPQSGDGIVLTASAYVAIGTKTFAPQ